MRECLMEIFSLWRGGKTSIWNNEKGYKRMLITAPKIVHFEGESSGNKARYKYGLKSHLYILRKYMNPFTYMLAWIYYRIRS